MDLYGQQTTRRSFCTRSAALPVALSGIGSFTPLRPDPVFRWHHTTTGTGGLVPTATDDERVYAFTENEDMAVAISVDDGSEQWRFEGGKSGIPPMSIGEENVYAVSLEEQGFTALDCTTGEVRWQSPVPGIPLIGEETVFAADDTLYAYSATDGATDWTFEVSKGSSGLALTPDTIFVGSTGRLYAVRREDGSERWGFEIADASKRRYLDPVQADAETSRVLVWDYLKRTIRLFDAEGGTESWHYVVDTQQDIFRGVVTERSALVVEGNDVVAVDLSDGTERWRFTAREGLSPRLQLFDHTDAVLARSQYRVYCISLDDGTGRWTFDSNGAIYGVGTDEDVTLTTLEQESKRGRVVRLSGRDGSLLWVTGTGSGRTSTVTSNGRVYAGTESGLKLLTTPAGVMGRIERTLESNTAGLLAGGIGLAAVAGGAYHLLSE